jgi:hypothetical protein
VCTSSTLRTQRAHTRAHTHIVENAPLVVGDRLCCCSASVDIEPEMTAARVRGAAAFAAGVGDGDVTRGAIAGARAVLGPPLDVSAACAGGGGDVGGGAIGGGAIGGGAIGGGAIGGGDDKGAEEVSAGAAVDGCGCRRGGGGGGALAVATTSRPSVSNCVQ